MADKTNLTIRHMIILFLAALSATTIATGKIIYPIPNIQWAINQADDGDTILLLPCIHTGPGNYDIDFLGKAITVRGSDPNDPNIVAATIIDCQSSESEPHRGFNFINNEDSNSIIDGLTITNGFGHFETIGKYEIPVGGGIYCYQSSPTIKNCIITDNRAYIYHYNGLGLHIGGFGGGIYCYQSNPEIKNCIIKNNKVGDGGYAFGVGGRGGGIYGNQSSPVISNCTITNNQTEWLEYTEDWYPAGGGIYLSGGNPIIRDCSINGNYCGHTGGGVVFYSTAEINNCDITNNQASGFGGGLSIGSNIIIRNCKILNNWAFIGGGGIYGSGNLIANCVISKNTAWGDPDLWGGIIAEGGGIYSYGTPIIINCTISGNDIGWGETGGICCSGSPTIKNCIVWSNDDDEISGGNPMVTYSNVQSSWPGTGNIDVNPLFVDAVNEDYHLKSQAGRWDPNSQTWVQDDATSLCIDAGNPGCPLGDEHDDVNNVRINMGAFGGTAKASKGPANWAFLADLTNDRIVDFSDLDIFVYHWLETGQCIPSDLNRNGFIDLKDFALMAYHWLEGN